MDKLNIEETTLKGSFVVTPQVNSDHRGEFFRVFCSREFASVGHHKEFVQFNQSVNKLKGLVRGMHLQREPHQEIKLVRCIRGSVYDVIVDLRIDSPTFLKWFGVELSEKNRKLIYIPEGFAHGFQTLQENSELLYHHTEYYNPQSEGGLNYLDPIIGIEWPLPVSLISDRDQNLPMFKKQ